MSKWQIIFSLSESVWRATLVRRVDSRAFWYWLVGENWMDLRFGETQRLDL
ncbi:hypothetical protein S7335_2009 [Synechococcus sp. PCC 7335]|nr:hypothetical protein S7335_2009 [Synechococcus sp. PCC 7335]